MAADSLMDGGDEQGEDSYLASVSDLMVGMLFIFIIMLMAYALNYRSAEHQADETYEELLEKSKVVEEQRDILALERDRLSMERDLLAEERDNLRRQHDELSDVTTYLLSNNEIRNDMLVTVQDLLRERDVDVVLDAENGILRLPESLLFASGEAVLRPEGERALRELASALALTLPCYSEAPVVQQADCSAGDRPVLEAILIEGHTDDRPIRTAEFDDNWDLAAERAVNTYQTIMSFEKSLDFLRNGRGEALLGVSAYEAQRPIASNTVDEGRRLNRRIDLRFVMAAPSREELGKIHEQIKSAGQ